MTVTFQEAKAMIKGMPRVSLGFFPTPLYRLGSLSEELGINLWIKRDDFTGSNLFGGNKTRKLEFLIGKAKAEGAECVFTYGATQSNHAMQTSWAAAKNGLRPILYLAAVVPPDPDDYKANLLLDGIYGAEIHVVDLEEGESFAEAEKRSFKMGKSHIARLKEQGIISYDIPMGGANEYGTLGYVNCMIELAEQMNREEIRFDHMYHSTGSGGTMAGIVAGKHLLGLTMQVHSVTAMDVGAEDKYAGRAGRMASEALGLLGVDESLSAEDFLIDQNHYGPGYECPSEEGSEAIRLLARREGILVDPVYSGKAFAGLLADVRSGAIPAGSNVLFLHTGGSTVFFAEKAIIGDLV
ncbi:MAG: D-cysteine desulfhydrase family protein [Firmicutes bacterium]|nr:D-cysteine desulfhydrase family protein [Bacillota bacterium]